MKNKNPESLLAQIQTKKLPPVNEWNPELSGDIDIRIARNGIWFHEGVAIKRDKLVRLFSTILRREDDNYYLLTPVEKWRIQVDDAPFVATHLEVAGEGDEQSLAFTTNVGDHFFVDSQHPIHVEIAPVTKEPSPYVLVRDKLEALISRAIFYELVNLGIEQSGHIGVYSHKTFFSLGKLD